MDIAVLYQEYQRYALQSEIENSGISEVGGGQFGLHQRQNRDHQPQNGTSAGNLLKSIRMAMPKLLSPRPNVSRLSSSLPLDNSSQEDAETETSREEQQQQQQYQKHQLESQHQQQQKQKQQERRSNRQLRSYGGGQHSLAPARDTRKSQSLPRSAPIAPAGSNRPNPDNCNIAKPASIEARHATSSKREKMDTTGRNSYPLVVIDPKDVKRVLTKIVGSTMRELLSREQDNRERCLMRQIKQTLGDFEASLAEIVKSVVAAKPHKASQQLASTAFNNSAECQSVTANGSGVCASIGSLGDSSRDSGQTIMNSCSQSDDRETGSTRVRMVESDNDVLATVISRPLHLSNQTCPGCASVCDNYSSRLRNRYQKNFNHARSPGISTFTCTTDGSADRSCGNCITSGDDYSVSWDVLQPANDAALADSRSAYLQSFPRFSTVAEVSPRISRRQSRRQRQLYEQQQEQQYACFDVLCTDEQDDV